MRADGNGWRPIKKHAPRKGRVPLLTALQKRSVFNVSPNLALHRIGQPSKDGQEDDDLHAQSAALFKFWLRGPLQEGADIMRHLFNSSLGAIGVFHLIGVERRAHGDLIAREVAVEMHPIHQGHARRRILIANQQCK